MLHLWHIKLVFQRQYMLLTDVLQELRKPRADWAVAAAAANGRGLHLARGTTQEERDRAFRSANKSGGENPDKAIDK